MTDHMTDAGHMVAAPRIDPDKLLELAARREKNGVVTLSWAMMLQIIEQLREYCPPARIATAVPVTEAMISAAEDAHMPFGDMRAALEAAQSVATANEPLEKERAERERFENLFAATCETLGRVKRALGMPDEAIGTEPEQAAVLRQERDALAAHVERLRGIHNHPFWGTNDHWMQEREAFNEARTTSLDRRDARVKAEALHELLMQPDDSAVGTRQRAMDNRDHYRRLAEGASDA